jgi:hypothetical protein
VQDFWSQTTDQRKEQKVRKGNAQQETVRTKNSWKDNATPVLKKEVATESRRRENSQVLNQQAWIRLYIWDQYDCNKVKGGSLVKVRQVGKGRVQV